MKPSRSTRGYADKQYTARLFLFARAHLALAQGDAGEAQAAIDEARATLSTLPNPGDPAWRWIHAYAARLALHQRRYEDARQAASAALALSRQQAIDPAASLFVGEDLVTVAQASRALGDIDRARENARAAMAHFVAVEASMHPSMARAQSIAANPSRE